MVIDNKYPICHISRLRMGTDGNGIRTLVLTEGCPLRCKYCINPFTWNGSWKTKYFRAEELYKQLLIDRPYLLATNGGITFGGGEPLLYPELIKKIRNICEPELTIYVETALNVPRQNLSEIVNDVDMFYVDIKSMDPKIYLKYTGKDNADVLNNLQFLVSVKGPDGIVVRIPLIQGYTDAECQYRDRDQLQKIGITQFDLFRYRMPNQNTLKGNKGDGDR